MQIGSVTQTMIVSPPIKRKTSMKHAMYYYGDGFMFILTDTKTIVRTGHQTFLIKHDHRNYTKSLERLREMIVNDEMKSISDLISYCSFKPGRYRNQMCGLELVPTKIERHI